MDKLFHSKEHVNAKEEQNENSVDQWPLGSLEYPLNFTL